MALNRNNVFIQGYIAGDVETKTFGNGNKISTFTVANNRTYKSGEEKKEEVSFFDVEAFGHTAEFAEKYLAKGTWVQVEGRLEQDRWEKDGAKFSRVKIVTNDVDTLPKGKTE